MKSLPRRAQIFVALVIAAGAGLIAMVLPVSTDEPLLFASMLVLSVTTSVLKINLPLPRSRSTMSVSYAVDFAALLMLGTPLAMVIRKVWNENFLWSGPGYFVGAAVATTVPLLQQYSSQLLLPLAVRRST
jgi:hypothetical protein